MGHVGVGYIRLVGSVQHVLLLQVVGLVLHVLQGVQGPAGCCCCRDGVGVLLQIAVVEHVLAVGLEHLLIDVGQDLLAEVIDVYGGV